MTIRVILANLGLNSPVVYLMQRNIEGHFMQVREEALPPARRGEYTLYKGQMVIVTGEAHLAVINDTLTPATKVKIEYQSRDEYGRFKEEYADGFLHGGDVKVVSVPDGDQLQLHEKPATPE